MSQNSVREGREKKRNRVIPPFVCLFTERERKRDRVEYASIMIKRERESPQ